MRQHFHLLLLLLFALLAAPRLARAQAPDLSKFPAYADKMTAWVTWCESLRLNASSNIVQLQAAGAKGLQLARADDYGNRARFFTYTALSYYYQSKFDSAQYYFYAAGWLLRPWQLLPVKIVL
jgi:hypothetical protein